MGLLFESGDIDILEPVLEEKSECRLETEVYLPDYLPDVQKLLRSEIIPRVASRDMLAGRITIEGEAEIRIFYKSSDDSVSCAVTHKEFSHTFAVSEPDADYDVSTETVGSINSVRASGPRKIAVKAEITTSVIAVKKSVLQIVETVSNGIEARKERISAISNAESSEREIRVTEEIELPETLPEISALLYAEAKAKVADATVSNGRFVIKGDLTVKPVCLASDGKLVDCEFSFPVSHIFDIPNLDEGYVCDAELQIVSVYAEAEQSSEGKNRVIDCEVVMNAILHAYKTSEYEIITDVFSPCSELTEEYVEAKYLTCYDFYHDEKNVKGQIKTENAVSSIINVYTSPRIMRVSADNGCLKAEGIVNADIIYVSDGSGVCSKKADIPFEFSFPYNCDFQLRCETNVSVAAVSYNISGENSVDLRCDVAIKASVCAERRLRVVSEVASAGEKESCGRCPIILYFAESGESAWDISKKYGASFSEVISENTLDGDEITTAKMLIIPLKR
ncbi:MAG: DUF3794 domain-containing protein [Clostridia bacterium]|nr:DUF3794 domain-containing protein [Clostridia bacterium]